MRTPREIDPRVCSIDSAMKVIGEKWALLVLREITFGQHRFDDIASNTGAARDILAARLKSLEAAGVIRRELYQERPARYAYHLTDAGSALFGLLHVVRDWGDRFSRDDPEYVAAFTHSCGAKLRTEVRCAECGEELVPGSAVSDRDVHRSDVTTAH